MCCVSDPAPKSLTCWTEEQRTPSLPHTHPAPHLSRLPWSKAWCGISRKSRWSHRRPCQWAEEWGVRRKWNSNWTGSWWSRGSVDSTVRFPAWKRNKTEVAICSLSLQVTSGVNWGALVESQIRGAGKVRILRDVKIFLSPRNSHSVLSSTWCHVPRRTF